jgi:hypothetical protein
MAGMNPAMNVFAGMFRGLAEMLTLFEPFPAVPRQRRAKKASTGESSMGSIRISIAAALALGVAAVSMPTASAQILNRKIDCTATLAQYNDAIRQFQTLADQARVMAEQNPLYESDVKYYASVLIDSYECAKTAAPVTTALR